MTTVSLLPPAPNRNDPSTFADKADAWVAAIDTWTTEVNTVAGEVNTDAITASAAVSTASTQASNASASATTASNWAIKTDDFVSGSDNSAKSWAVGGTGTGNPTEGNAKDWATKTAAAVAGGEYSAKEYASGDTVESAKRHASGTVATGSAKDWAAKTGSFVAESEYSAKEYASGDTVESAKRHASGTVATGSAKDWAAKTDDAVAGGEYSAKYHAQQAASSASDALTSKNQAEALVEKYQGELASDPTLDKQGNPISTGDWYVNTTSGLIKAYNGTSWVNSINVAAGVSSINLQQGDLQLKTINSNSLLGAGNISILSGVLPPVLVSPSNSATDIKMGKALQVTEGLTAYDTAALTKIQFSKFSDFSVIYSETSWLAGTSGTVNYTVSDADIEGGEVQFYWRAVSKTTVQGAEYISEFSGSRSFTTALSVFDPGDDIDGLTDLVTIQPEWNAGTTYSTGQTVIIRKSPRRFVEYNSLTNGNVGNNPETSPAHWQQIYDNRANTSGYFGEVLGSTCVVDKGEWLSTTTYSIGDMVVVKNIPTPLKQSDLTAYVAKTANTNKPPASNPSDWEQRNALPTGTSLAQTLGIGNATPEVLINNDSGWLKFVHNGTIKYIAKKPFMHTVSWNDIAKAEAVYGNRTVRIGSRLFRVSLLSGAEADPTTWTTGNTDPVQGVGSEWNTLMYRVHNTVPSSQVGANWWNFSDADIVVTTGNGRYTWCRETVSSTTARRVLRGVDSLSHFGTDASSGTSTTRGWRPCLTLISEPEAPSSNLYNAEASGVGPSVASLQYDPITDTGYYGEVTSSNFYTGTQISTACGVSSGTLHNDTEGWLKFYWHGQVLFISKKTYRYSVSWDQLNAANSIFGVNLGSTGKKTITHSGSSTSYDVKLMKGAIKDPSPATSPGRQWNELLYRVCTGTETGEIGSNWATLSPSTDLGINSSNGAITWCQEVYQPNAAVRVLRGRDSLSYFYLDTSSDTSTSLGWRPCLALVR
jgi:hypothetical protein